MKEIKLYKSRLKATKLILGSGVFVLIGFFLLESNRIVGLSSIIFFGLCLLVGLFQFFDRRPQIIINEIGIFDRNTLKEFINWEIIYDAYLLSISGQDFICLVIDENYSPSKNKSKLYKKFVKLNREIGAQELNLAIGSIDVNPNKMLEFVKAMISAERNLKVTFIEKGI